MTKAKDAAMAQEQDAPDEQDAPGPYHGQGGSYVIDPDTGRRVLVERTQERGEVAPPTEKE